MIAFIHVPSKQKKKKIKKVGEGHPRRTFVICKAK